MAVLISGAAEFQTYQTITHVNSVFGTPNNGSSPGLTTTSTVTKPSGIVEGDFLLAYVNANKIGITGVPSGWTLLDNQDASVDLYRNAVYWIVATSTEVAATNFVWTNGDANAPIWAAISAYRGVDPQAGIQTSNATVATTTEPQTTPSVTTTTPCLIVSSRTVRLSDSNVNNPTTFSGTGTQRFTNGNRSTVGYFGTSYDPGSNTAAGSISGFTISHTTGTLTDGVVRTIALQAAVQTSVMIGQASRRASQW